MESSPTIRRLSDYQPPDWLVPEVSLRFELDPARTLVHARLTVVRNGSHQRPLILDGERLELLSLDVDGVARPLPNQNGETLTVPLAGDRAVIETFVAIHPAENSRLMGLYASSGNLCTQCEAEGFRAITYFPDRPDVLSRYQVRLEADAGDFPVLLSNGNPGAAGPLENGRHFAEWDDPFAKPSYLFALVAGKLAAHRDEFTTASGRRVALAIWVAPADVPRCRHAMDSLKAAMAWDERVYGREYDLDVFNIVAVHDFNFGAMENKGLNIFNAKYVLADPDTATDFDYDSIAAIVAHEYFHNWSGNRVTCRDWFQLSLKEGFTVFRDQQFSADLGSPAVRRIEAVRALRASQFAEDAGPLAHPVQPQSYQEISNFYTATVYNKGAELVGMMAHLLGPQAFRRATDRYFADQDGKAATVEDFLAAMATEGLDRDRFRQWYDQPGTPVVTARVEHDAVACVAELTLTQHNPRAEDAAPLLMPFDVALWSADGRKLAVQADQPLQARTTVLRFRDVQDSPIPSLNRGFRAPVLVEPPPSRTALAVLAAHEDDPFARYEALQQLMMSALMESIDLGAAAGHADVARAVAATLAGWQDDPAMVAESILLPSEALIADRMADRGAGADPEAIHGAREALRLSLEAALCDQLWQIWQVLDPDAADLSAAAKGQRRLRGILLSLMLAADGEAAATAAAALFRNAAGMTDRMAALSALSHSRHSARYDALAAFHDRYQAFPEVLDKWFAVQAGSTRSDTLEVVRTLAGHPQFDCRNPNRLRALMLGFAMNHSRFHDRDGQGYRFLADHVLAVDRLNPQSAARLVQPLTRWRRLAAPWSGAMQAELTRIAATKSLSRDVQEVTATGLK